MNADQQTAMNLPNSAIALRWSGLSALAPIVGVAEDNASIIIVPGTSNVLENRHSASNAPAR